MSLRAFLLLTAIVAASSMAVPPVAISAGNDKTASSDPTWELKTRPVVDRSARGWSLRAGPNRTTIVISPRGKEFNVGETQYPDFLPTNLWLIKVPALKRTFLVLHNPPAASGAAPITLFTIKGKGKRVRIVRSADIPHHYEWHAGSTTAADVRKVLFVDCDGDGKPELADDDVWVKWGGTVTYYALVRDRFVARWRDSYSMSKDNERIVRTGRARVRK